MLLLDLSKMIIFSISRSIFHRKLINCHQFSRPYKFSRGKMKKVKKQYTTNIGSIIRTNDRLYDDDDSSIPTGRMWCNESRNRILSGNDLLNLKTCPPNPLPLPLAPIFTSTSTFPKRITSLQTPFARRFFNKLPDFSFVNYYQITRNTIADD